MKDATRRELLEVLTELSEVAPEIRLGQLVTNLSYIARGLANESVWDVEDEELLAAAREHLEQWREQHEAASQAGG
jgi:hypothetical protein